MLQTLNLVSLQLNCLQAVDSIPSVLVQPLSNLRPWHVQTCWRKYLGRHDDAVTFIQDRNEIILISIINIPENTRVKAVPLQAWSGPVGSRMLRFPDFMTTAQVSGKVVSLTHRPPLPPGNAPVTYFCWRLSRPQGHSAIGRILCQWKIPMTPAGIEPANFRLNTRVVYAYFLKQC